MSEFTVTRTLQATRDRVWAALTQPASFERWLPAKPGSAVLDVRTGGSWQATVTSPEGQDIPLEGTYIEVSDPGHLVMSVPGGAVTDLTLQDGADGTTTVVYHFGDVDESLHAMVTESVDGALNRIRGVLDS